MPAQDDFQSYSKGLAGPVSSAHQVMPHDTQDLPNVSRALFVGVGGDLRVAMLDGQTVTFGGLGPGWHPLRVARIIATGTTASAIVACW